MTDSPSLQCSAVKPTPPEPLAEMLERVPAMAMVMAMVIVFASGRADRRPVGTLRMTFVFIFLNLEERAGAHVLPARSDMS